MGKAKDIADTSEKDTKQTILDATVDLIRAEGFRCATLRNIAAKADTNLALINYHYGSKENLLGEAVRELVSTFDDAFNVLEDKSLPPQARLKQFFMRYIQNLSRYPGLAMQMLDQRHQILGSMDEYARYSKLMRIERMHEAVQEITGEQDRNKLMTMLLQLYGAVVFPVIMISSISGDQEDELAIYAAPPIEEQLDELFGRYFHQYQ